MQRYAMRCGGKLSKANASALCGAMLEKLSVSTAELVCPDILFTSKVFHFELHAVQVRPGGCQAQESAQRLCGAEEFVEAAVGP